jgi:hypothetical protein
MNLKFQTDVSDIRLEFEFCFLEFIGIYFSGIQNTSSAPKSCASLRDTTNR